MEKKGAESPASLLARRPPQLRWKPLPGFVSADRPARYPRIISGEHLFAQTAQTFGYLKRRMADGAVSLPQGAQALESFGQQARAKSAAR
jgi:hypothetical protein